MSVDAGVNLTCASDDDCPDGFNCKALDDESFCIAAEVLAKEPLRLLEAGPLTIAAPTTFSTQPDHNTITATFTLSETPKALTVSLDAEEFDCGDPDGGAYTCTLVVTDSIAPGAGQVRLKAHDEAFNAVDVSAPVFIDDAGPAVLGVSTTITPPSPVRQNPGSATVGSRLDVVISFNEALGAAPAAVTLVPGDEPCEIDSAEGARLACHVVVASDAAGPRSLQLSAVDAVANSAAVDAALDVAFDFAAPAAPAVDADGAVVLVRAPWGQGAEDAATIAVALAAGAVEAGAQLAVFSDAAGSRLIAVGGSDAAGSVDLGVLDRSAVFVAAVDDAGLLSPVVAVRDQRFITTLGSKAQADFNGNPHVAFAVGAFDDDRDDGVELADADYAALFPADAGAVTVTPSSSWSQRAVSDDPGPRSGACLAYDTARGVAVLFGGRDGSGDLGDTWLLDDGRWQPQGPRTSPSPRSGVSCAYDPGRDVVVLVGGAGTRDVWEWNGDTWRKKGELPENGTPRYVAAYDIGRDGVVVVDNSAAYLIDDVIGAPAAFPFVAGDAAAVATDDGFVAVNADGSAVVASAAGVVEATGLPAGSAAPVVYVDDGRVFAIVADNDGGGDPRFVLSDTTFAPVAPLPLGDRAGARAVALGAGDLGVVVVGGLAGGTAFVDGDGAFDLQTQPSTSAPVQLAFDPGDADDPAGLLANIGGDLFRLTEAGFVELGNAFDGILVDGDADSRAYVVIDGGTVLEFDGDGEREFFGTFITDNEAMNGQVTAGARCVRQGDGLVFVSGAGATFTFSTASNAWTAAPGGPVPASGFGLATAGGNVVLFPDIAGHTWTFDGVWHDLEQIGPGLRTNVGFVSDVDDGSALLFGGIAGGNFSDETWSFDGASWTQVQDDNAPRPLAGVVMGYDARRHRVVVTGGVGPDASLDVFEHDSGAADAPALRFAVDLGAAGVDVTGADAVADLVAVAVDVGPDAGALVWRRGRWAPLAGDPDGILTGADPTVHFAVPGPRGGAVTVDHFQATFTLRSH